MFTLFRATRTGSAVNDTPDVVVSLRRGGMNRLPLLAMMVPLLLLVGMGLVGLTRHWTQYPSLPGTLAKAEVETIVHNLTKQLTTTEPEILSATMGVAYSVQRERRFPEWSVICRTGQDYYLFRVNGKDGKVFGVNHLDDISGQERNIANSEPTIEAGLTPPVMNRTPQAIRVESNHNGKQAAESAARRYLPAFGLLMREVNPVPVESEPSYEANNEESRVWTFTYFLKTGVPLKGAIRVSVDSTTGRLESFWNPASSL